MYQEDFDQQEAEKNESRGSKRSVVFSKNKAPGQPQNMATMQP